jgi:hypothetical protein
MYNILNKCRRLISMTTFTPTRVGMSLDEFIELGNQQPFELINGERKPKLPNVAGHNEVAQALFLALHLYPAPEALSGGPLFTSWGFSRRESRATLGAVDASVPGSFASCHRHSLWSVFLAGLASVGGCLLWTYASFCVIFSLAEVMSLWIV